MAEGVHSYTFRVRYAETDAMGVAHHSSYVIWFEAARVELLRDLSLPYTELEQRGFSMPVIELNVRYQRPAYFDDLLTVQTWIAELGEVRLRLAYRLIRERDGKAQVIAEAQTQHAFLDRNGRITRLRNHPDLQARFQELVHQLRGPA